MADLTWRSDDHRLVGHCPPGEYVRTVGQVADEFDAWVDRCAAYDADPDGWSAERRRAAEAYIRDERERN